VRARRTVGVLLALLGARAAAQQPFRITVVDDATGRGVPAVELTTVNGIPYVTDSAGVVAFAEPGLLGGEVFFAVRSHGYTYPTDGFGNTGVRLTTASGGAATVPVTRVNIAERLYRITGQGIYRDSVLLGDTPPVAEPLLAGGVLGQDSALVIPYRGRLRWIFGDTSRASYPLGNFAASGATSLLPADGGLAPDVGVDLTYFVDGKGFSRGMCPIEGEPGPVWLDGLMTVADPEGRTRLIAHWMRVKSLGELYAQGLARYDDDQDRFVPCATWPLDATLYPRSHPIRVDVAGAAYWYFPSPYPLVRVRDEWGAVADPARYEAYTCLVTGARFDAEHPALDRDADGRLVYGWKADTAPVGPAEQRELVRRGHARAEELLLQLRDVDTGQPVQAHAGSVHWNAYRGRWVMIAQEVYGTSLCGEIWFAEADTPTGPWVYARKVVTHDDYSFYNPVHHAFFDQDGGRRIYFQGTFTRTFSGAPVPVPRYDYNQLMYRLDLADPRLALPVAVYEVATEADVVRRTGAELRRLGGWDRVRRIAAFTLVDAQGVPREGARTWPVPDPTPHLDRGVTATHRSD